MNLSQKIGYLRWRSGPNELNQLCVNHHPIMMSPTKHPKSELPKFFLNLN